MTTQQRRAKSPLFLRHLLTTAAVLLFAAAFFIAPAMAVDAEHDFSATGITDWKPLSEHLADPNYNAWYDVVAGNYYLTEDTVVPMGLYVEDGTTFNLCLNGHVLSIDKVEGEGLPIIYIIDGGTFNLYDCDMETEHFFREEDGLWIWDDSYTTSSNKVTGGVLTGALTGASADSGAVYVSSKDSTFNMHGGNIVGNHNTNKGNDVMPDMGGAGVACAGTFNMYGGTIQGNLAENTGGGVYTVTQKSVFNMYGGEITHNTAGKNGGGVFVENTFSISGDAVISGNKVSSGSDSNLYLASGQKIAIGTDGLGENADIHLSMADAPTTADKSVPITTGTISDDYSERFTPDDAKYTIVKEADNSLSLKAKSYTITWMNGEQTLKTESVLHGETPAYSGDAPAKAAEEGKYTYTFDGWSDKVDGTKLATIPEATADATYYAVFTKTAVHYTLTFKDEGENGEVYLTTTKGFGELIIPPTPTKDDSVLIGWEPAVPATVEVGGGTYIAKWQTDSYKNFNYELNNTAPTRIVTVPTSTLSVSIPIDFINTKEDIVPESWIVTVTVTDVSTTDPITLKYALKVADGYATDLGNTGSFQHNERKNEFHVESGTEKADSDVDKLFTVTISDIPNTITTYKIRIDITTNVYKDGTLEQGAKTMFLETTLPVVEMVGIETNLYSDSPDGKPWNLDNPIWATITIENPGQKTFMTNQQDSLYQRGNYHLSITKSGIHEIFTVTDGGEPQKTTDTQISGLSADNYLVLTVGDNDLTADQFIIKFTGHKMGDVAYTPGAENIVDVVDAGPILRELLDDPTILGIAEGYEIYGKVVRDPGTGVEINSQDATFVYLKGVNKLTPEQEKSVEIKRPNNP